MKIGIMGGTFDPIHNGHIMLGRAALTQFGLDEVWFMPNGNPPHKKSSAIQSDAGHRAFMTQLAIDGIKEFKLQLYEVERKEISYSYETLEYFHRQQKDDEFYFIIGADSLFAIESWVKPERIMAVCTILAAYRDEVSTPEIMQKQITYLKDKYHARIALLRTPLMPISSHELRQMIEEGRSAAGYLPANVEEYIKKEGLYGSKDNKAMPQIKG